MLAFSQIQRALVITAHPDDVDFGAFGTVAKLSAAGAVVSYCLVTDGQAGGFDLTIPRTEMARIRQAEQTRAAALAGVHDLHFLSKMDGQVEYTRELRGQLSRVIRRVRPQVVLTQSPTIDLGRIYASHPDHLATGQAALAAVYPDARNPFAFTELIDEGHEPWAVDEVWVMGHPDPTDYVDITDQIDHKIAGLRCHESQHRDPDLMEQRVRAWNADNATNAGLPEGASAEGFYVVNTR